MSPISTDSSIYPSPITGSVHRQSRFTGSVADIKLDQLPKEPKVSSDLRKCLPIWCLPISKSVFRSQSFTGSVSRFVKFVLKFVLYGDPLQFLISNLNSIVTIKLDSTNYLTWKAQISAALEVYDFLGYVDGSIPMPSVEVTTGDATEIVTNPNLLNGRKQTDIFELRNDFQRVKKDAAKSMKSYLDEIKQITDKLAATANLISDEEIIFITLKGLPREYVSFKTAIRARETSITFEELSNLLLSEEINISIDELELNSPIGISTALTAQGNTRGHQNSALNPNSQGNRGRGNYRSNYRGNYQNNNRGNYKGRGNYSNRGSFNPTYCGNGQAQWNLSSEFGSAEVRCQICNKPRHIAKDCWYRTDLHYQPPTQALMASNETPANDQWFFDSGATHHITSNVGNLYQPEKYSGTQKVVVGDGKHLNIKHKGDGRQLEASSSSRE
ncbi:hypothetical protein F0562_013935 [Nyssa sinensis]|uniref:Retrotransposon Copia-like N-terminal domain-containing protein n=1 Tax=Nyssa sinensis TaxID=561372 RepID=A0A5J4ZLV4_9ASTE|nr:hypothetical protein F0562_013935 [Nyssa sinensis]